MTEKVDRYKGFAAQLVRNPDDPDTLINQYSLLGDHSTRENSKHYYHLAKRAYEVAPEQFSPIFHYASACHRAGLFDESYDLYLKALNVAPDDMKAETFFHCGLAERAAGRMHCAMGWYEKAIAATDNEYFRLMVQKDRALCMMADGRLTEGFRAYECRKPFAKMKLARHGGQLIVQQRLPPGIPYWNGEDLNGKTVVVFHEEGAGDFIQFSRFIPQFKNSFGGQSRILLTGADAGLLEMVADNLPMVDGIVPLEGFDCDYVVGSMSLPWRIGVEYENVSGAPYIKAEPATFPLRGELNVGLVWRGSPAYGMDAHRSMAFTELCSLFSMPGVAFYSLQIGDAQNEVTKLGFDGFVANLSPFARNWRATARLVARLDCVVGVDTAVLHLAGALGKAGIMLTTNACDWRWSRCSESTPWYGSLRVVRQSKQDDWAPCVARAKEMIGDMLNARRTEADTAARSRLTG